MPPEEPTPHKTFWRRHYRIVRNGTTLVLLILYLLMGAGVFHALEARAETERQQKAALKIQQLLGNLTCIPNGELQQLLEAAKELSGARLSRNTSGSLTVQFPPNRWSVDGAIFFSMTILTTIGYGNLVPKTSGGQHFCLFYALFGIPLYLLFLANIGYRIAQYNGWLTQCLFGSRLTQGSRTFRAAQFVILFLVGMTLFMCLPSLGFSHAEGWTYTESFYYAFITLSTIGFGDYALSMDNRLSFKLILIILWIPCGLAWFSAILSTIQMLEDKIVPQNPTLEEEQNANEQHGSEKNQQNTLQNTDENVAQDSSQHQQHVQCGEAIQIDVYKDPPVKSPRNTHHVNTMQKPLITKLHV